MAITYHPKVGQILYCDFSQGFQAPEMVKSKRPVIVVSPSIAGRASLTTVVALSTVTPDPVQLYHCRLPRASLPMLGQFQGRDTWVKGDMIYAVGFHRLDLIKLGQRNPATGKRIYFTQRLGRERMGEIYGCILHALNLGKLIEHL